VLRARLPGAATRIWDTRVRNVPEVTRREIALSVANDIAERPVHDRFSSSAIAEMSVRRIVTGLSTPVR
jgi:hypothetical protein